MGGQAGGRLGGREGAHPPARPKRVLIVASSIGVVLLTLFGAARLWLLASLAPLGGREPVAGLVDSVTVLWDSLAVPHVIAASDDDLFVALGYLHARDRMWQMDLLRHAAEGRLSELFGEATVASDRDFRDREFGRIAASRLAAMGPGTRRVLERYAAGVNAWLAADRRALEFRLVGHAPEPWEPRHSLELGVLQAWDLRTTGDELDLASVAERLGVERARELVLEASPSASGGTASNSWVIAGHRTASGKPILANDPHLLLRAPSVWYLVGAHAPTYEVVGATIPGAPVVILGHTARSAWGFTNAMVDDLDYLVEELSSDSSRARTARGWAPVEALAETIRVKDGDVVIHRRLRTVHGPIVRGEWDPGPGRALTLVWTGQAPGSDELAAFLGMARGAGWRDFAAALAGFKTPEQNVVSAHVEGDIAFWLVGRVPVRRSGVPFTPAPAWTGAGDWVRYLDTAELPHVRNPVEGWIVTANNRLVGPEYRHFLSRHYDHGYRAARIAELVRADSSATTASVSRQQMDVVDGFARAHRSLAARAATAAMRADLGDQIRAWNGAMEPGLVEPAVFWSWYKELQRLTYEDESPDYRPAGPLHLWMAAGESRWFDDVRTAETETLDSLARRAMLGALTGRRAVTWGEVHQTWIDHPLAAVPVLGRLAGFRVGPLEKGGSNYTINNASSTSASPPFPTSYGPSLRHVVDLGDVDGSGGFILPTGQSGHPLSRHYRDQTERWLRGELWVIPVDVRRVRAIDTLVLIPGVPSSSGASAQ